MNKNEALSLVRHLIAIGLTREQASSNSAVPSEFLNGIKAELERDDNIILERAHLIATNNDNEWLQHEDRSTWYYWPTLRNNLLSKILSAPELQSIEDTTDQILQHLADPKALQFDIRGLVLGYVQSGKTTNFTAVIAKAVDCGYRLIIVLSGIDKGLRLQTQIRLQKQLVGIAGSAPDAVPIPPSGKQWFCVTTPEVDGDFNPGTANQAPLQGPTPVIMVVKKNGMVLRKLLNWLEDAPTETLKTLPVLVIDDESDLASIDIRGSYQLEDGPPPEDYEPPSVINGLIRDLLNSFQKKAYIAYTATPFANVLIPHNTYDPQEGSDLYPKDFIVDLPKPPDYFGADELFGMTDPISETQVEGLDVIRIVPDVDIDILKDGKVPESLEKAILGFVLAGAVRAYRGEGDGPATMLIHISQMIESHTNAQTLVEQKFSEFKNTWRYQRKEGIQRRLQELWKSDFQPVIRNLHPELADASFDKMGPFIGAFFEAVQIRTINSATGNILDYEREPNLKVIAIGGNKFSRGLTLEGLLASFFVRRTVAYDTLMQMGRWFGFRRGYEDLTRIWITSELSGWFSDLAYVEHSLREDIRKYEDMQITPYEVGTRILQHPAMQVTSPLKRRYTHEMQITQSYSCQLAQMFKFPLDDLPSLAKQADFNLIVVKKFLHDIGEPKKWDKNGPIWSGVPANMLVDMLKRIRHENLGDCSLPLITSYIEHQLGVKELLNWTVAVRGLSNSDNELGEAKWDINGGHIWQISRTRKKSDRISVGVTTSPEDQIVGLSDEAIEKVKAIDPTLRRGEIIRSERPATEGLLLIYPISKNSKPQKNGTNRMALFEDISNQYSRDLIALALSFPGSLQPQPIQAFLVGTNEWRPVI